MRVKLFYLLLVLILLASTINVSAILLVHREAAICKDKLSNCYSDNYKNRKEISKLSKARR